MISEESKYYVYILLKTYTNGHFNYGDLYFSMEPFYIGKGKDKRINQSINVKRNKNAHKNYILDKIHSLNLTVTSIKYKENLTEEDAFLLEKELINKIGRSDRGLGPLANLTDGGEGGSGGARRKGDYPELYRSVLKYDINGIFIEEYPCIKKALKENSKSKNISYCCQNKRDTSGGFIWRYKKDDNFERVINTEEFNSKNYKGNFPVSVIQKNLSGEIIKEFSSIKEAEIETGCRSSKIVLVCQKKRNKVKEFIFEYKYNGK